MLDPLILDKARLFGAILSYTGIDWHWADFADHEHAKAFREYAETIGYATAYSGPTRNRVQFREPIPWEYSQLAAAQ